MPRTHDQRSLRPFPRACLWGDRRGSNPRPSEPQSDVMCFWGLLYVAESPYLSPFLCSRLPVVAAYCAPSGVSSGVNAYGIRPVPDRLGGDRTRACHTLREATSDATELGPA